MSRLTAFALLILSALVALLMALYIHQGQRHQTALLQLELEASQQDQARQAVLLEQLHQAGTDNDAAQADLRNSVESVTSALLKNKRVMEQLKNDQQEIKAWADARLPAAVIRLRQRPEIASAAAYQDWLSQRDGLPLAGLPLAGLPLAGQPGGDKRAAKSGN